MRTRSLRAGRSSTAAALLTVAAMTLAGCGSTVQAQGGYAAPPLRDDGLLAPGPAAGSEDSSSALGPAGSDGTAAESGLDAVDSNGSRVAGGAAEGPAGSTGVPGQERRPEQGGPGRGAAPVAGSKVAEVGIAYLENVSEAFGAGSDPNAPNFQLQAETMIRWINAHGGIGGRRAVPIYHVVDLTDPRPYDVTAQEICERWAIDHKVVAGIFPANMNTTLGACLSARGIMFVNFGSYLFDSKDYLDSPLMLNPGHLAGEVGARTYVEGLFAAGRLTRGEKVGVVRFDTGSYDRAWARGMKPALDRGGADVTSVYEAKQPTSTPEIANEAAKLQGTVLKFRNDGVSTVLFLCSGCAGVFMQHAESQGWRPKYGLSSWDVPHFRENSTPAAQLQNAAGVGWTPLFDVPLRKAPPPNATAALCQRLMQPIGQADTHDERIASYPYCDGLLTIHAAGRGLTEVTGRALVSSAERLGTSHASALTLVTRLAPGRHFGAAAYRPFTYDKACPCFTYTGAQRSFP